MDKKIVITWLLGLVAICFLYVSFLAKPINEALTNVVSNEKEANKKSVQQPQKPQKIIKKANLFEENHSLPLYIISEVVNLPEIAKTKVEEIIATTDVYYLKRHQNSVMLITGVNHNEHQRHDIEYVEVDFFGGVNYIPFGYIPAENAEKVKEDWKFKRGTKLPLKHIKYNSDKKVEYKEFWNYSDDEPIKYTMKDADENVISIKKETPSGESGLRTEYIVYDSEGNTKLSVSINYEFADITRFTYYNSEKQQDSFIVLTTYENGMNAKEMVYSSDYKLLNTYKAEYVDGYRTKIMVFNNEEKEIETLIGISNK